MVPGPPALSSSARRYPARTACVCDSAILPRGCGTSLSGEAVNRAVIIDFSKYLHGILEVDEARRLVHVQPGAVNQKVNQRVAEHSLLFAPDPSTRAYCTIGGNNSCGVHSLYVADGFSCATQIRDGKTGRDALHLAQVMKLARTHRDLDAYPERDPVLQGPRRLHRFVGRTPGR